MEDISSKLLVMQPIIPWSNCLLRDIVAVRFTVMLSLLFLCFTVNSACHAGDPETSVAEAKDTASAQRPDRTVRTQGQGLPQAESFGTYSYSGCPKSYPWRIDEDHMLWWDGKPYIPHAINEFHIQRNDAASLKKELDDLFEAGITDFFDLGFSADIFGNGGYNEQIRKTYETKLREMAFHISQKGGTYVFSYSLSLVMKQLGGGERTIDFMLSPRTQAAVRDDLKRFSALVQTPALRGVEFGITVAA